MLAIHLLNTNGKDQPKFLYVKQTPQTTLIKLYRTSVLSDRLVATSIAATMNELSEIIDSSKAGNRHVFGSNKHTEMTHWP
jgi:hypothetical protein